MKRKTLSFLLTVSLLIGALTLFSYATYSPSGPGDNAGIKAYGVDISKWQGSVNFSTMKNAGISYVILRAGHGTTEDPNFDTYYSGAKAAGLNVGAYWYCTSTTASNAVTQASKMLSVINGLKFEYPIYIDIEDSTQKTLGSTVLYNICTSFMNTIANAGYLPGFYSYYAWMNNNAILPTSTLSANYESWMARYYNETTSLWDTYDGVYGMWQYSSKGSGSRYGASSTYIDLDVCFKDYPTIVRTNGYNNYTASGGTSGDVYDYSIRGNVYSVTASALNMRSGPSTSYGIVTTASNGSTVTAICKFTNSSGTTWLYGNCNGYSGWMSMNYLALVNTAPSEGDYTITFDPNGGHITSGESSYRINYGQAYNEVMEEIPTAERSGYLFDGWYYGDFKLTSLGNTYALQSDGTFTARWIRSGYTVTYNANGGSGAPANQSKEHGVNIALSTETPERYGYEFDGWATSAGATAAEYEPGDTYSSNANLNLYAVWKPTWVRVVYDAMGGTGEPGKQGADFGTTISLQSGVPTYAGHTFLGWSRDIDAETATIQPGARFTMDETGDINLYAVWSPKEYRISYARNKGLASSMPASPEFKAKNASYTISDTVPTRSGYYFTGWNTDKNATTALYRPGDTYTANASLALYAIWSVRSPGDVNGDGTVDAKDVTVLQRYVNNWSVTILPENADVNGDGTADAKDVTLIRRYVNGWGTVLQ